MNRRGILVGSAKVLLVAGVAVAAALGAIYLPQWQGGALEEAQGLANDRAVALAARDATIDELRQEVDALREQVVVLQQNLVERHEVAARLEAVLGQSGDVAGRYSEVVSEYGALQAAHSALVEELAALQTSIASLERIRTPELAGDALLLDRSVPGVTYSRAICSGSMEPNIRCDDLLVLYQPDISDLRPGDVIYFRRQAQGCSGTVDGQYILHRITRVAATATGLRFHTKGDAIANEDACPVPAGDVMYKLLVNVRDARIQ